MIRSTVSALALSAAMLAGAPALAQPAAAPAPAAPAAQSEDARLAKFFQDTFMERLRQSPESLTQIGMKERYGELGDYTKAGQEKQVALAVSQAERMKKEFDRAKLSDDSKLSYDLYLRAVENAKTQQKWYWQNYAVSSNGSALDGIPVLMINAHRVETKADAEAYVSRLKAVERVAGEVAADIDERTAKGFLPPSFVFGRVIPDAKNQLKGAPFDSGADHPVWADFKKKVAASKADDSEKAQLLSEGEAAMLGPWKRGYERYVASLEGMSKKATTVNGVWALPDGDAFYADSVAFFTTTKMTPDQIHQTGLSEVARIRAEMEQIKAKVGFKGTLNQFFDHIRTDPKFRYPNTPEGKQQYLADATKIVDTYMKTAAEKQFVTLPKQAMEVRAVEPFREKTASTAFYNQGALDGSRPAIFYVNLADMTQVQKVQLEAIAYHEGAPGHHFQIARAQEQKDLPMFRRFAYQGAYQEGWGLYAEKLGKEAGFYQDPYNDMGRLSLEIWRAVRLVLDTGIHAKKWTREQSIKYMTDNTLSSELDVAREVDRYFTNPGQATSYKIGQLKILELREKARKAMGPKFDLRAFHEVVLGGGAIPLDVLESRVDAYIAGK